MNTFKSDSATIGLLNGDSLAHMANMARRSVSVIVTSPPFNLGIKYENYDDSISRPDYIAWTNRWLALAKEVLDDSGSLFLNMGGKPTDPTPPHDVLAVARRHFVLQNEYLWIKSIAIDIGDGEGETTKGHVKPINSDRFVNQAWEFVFHLTKRGDVPVDKLSIGVPFADKSNLDRGTRGKNGDRRCRGNVWYFPEECWYIPYKTIKSRNDDRGGHPATYPAELPDRCLRIHGLSRIKLSMDPFSGIGSTAMSCARLSIPHLGIEAGPSYHADAVRNVQEVLDYKKSESERIFAQEFGS